jgi:ABC-type lipoprotein release transport system permease subunit
MLLLTKLALRNLRRNLRRTLITTAAIALGLSLLMFSSSGTDGICNNMIATGTGSQAGHVVLQGPEDPMAERRPVLADAPALAATLASVAPDATITQRVFIDGLLASTTGTMGVGIGAVQPELEAAVNKVDDRLVEGDYLDDDPRGIVLGSTLAESLDVGLGDKVVLMAQGAEEIESRMFRVKGIFSMGIDQIDGFYGQITLPAAQELMDLGDGVHQIAAHLDSARDTERVTADARAALPVRDDLELLSWQQALPSLAEYVAAEKAEIYVVYAVIFFMVGLGIVNTVLMSVLERLRELGVMLALGTTPRRLAGLVITEAALLGVFASAVGVALGLAIVVPLSSVGLDLTALTGGTMEVAGLPLDFTIYPDLDPAKLAIYVAGVWLLTVLAAVYPAYKAATLKPVDCLKHR